MSKTPIHQKLGIGILRRPIRLLSGHSRVWALPVIFCAAVFLTGCSDRYVRVAPALKPFGARGSESAATVHVLGKGDGGGMDDNPVAVKPEEVAFKDDNPLQVNDDPTPHADDSLDVTPDAPKPSTFKNPYSDNFKDPLLVNDNPGMTSKALLATDRLNFDERPTMPTDHSHWLRGGIFNAKVGVYVNSVKLGDFIAPVDKDITWRLHKGFNTVTFVYDPAVDTAAAHLDVLESEHHPDVAPLASFSSDIRTPNVTQSMPDYQYADAVAKRNIKTFTFMAH